MCACAFIVEVLLKTPITSWGWDIYSLTFLRLPSSHWSLSSTGLFMPCMGWHFWGTRNVTPLRPLHNQTVCRHCINTESVPFEIFFAKLIGADVNVRHCLELTVHERCTGQQNINLNFLKLKLLNRTSVSTHYVPQKIVLQYIYNLYHPCLPSNSVFQCSKGNKWCENKHEDPEVVNSVSNQRIRSRFSNLCVIALPSEFWRTASCVYEDQGNSGRQSVHFRIYVYIYINCKHSYTV